MVWITLIFVAILSYATLVLFPKRWRILNKMKSFNGPPALPLVGNALELNVPRSDVLKVLTKWIQTYGRRYRMYIGLQPYIVIANAADMEKVLSSQTEIEKSDDYKRLHPWLGLGLLTSNGEKWFHRRKQLTPAFHFKILEDFLNVFNEQCSILKNVLAKKGDTSFDIFPVITHCALDIICESAMGRRVNAQEKSDSDYVRAIYRMSELIQHRQLRPWLHPDITWSISAEGKEEKRCLKILHGFTDRVIMEKKIEKELMQGRKEMTEKKSQDDDIYMGSGKKRLAFLDLLLEAQDTDPKLKDKDIREETDTFMFEGHDTTSAAASWTTFLLGCNPNFQKKVQEELDLIFGEDRNRDVTMADLTKMKYLECCIKEGLRLFPSVPFIGRKLINDLEFGDGKVAPASSTMFVFFYLLHRDETVFPDPERFDPDRFRAENIQGRHPFSYLPFSAGNRNCIGQKFALMEEKVMLSTIFRNFNVKAAVRREDVEVLCELIVRPENGLPVILQQR